MRKAEKAVLRAAEEWQDRHEALLEAADLMNGKIAITLRAAHKAERKLVRAVVNWRKEQHAKVKK